MTRKNPYYKGPISDHFDGKRFHNLQPGTENKFTDLVKWLITRKKKIWPKSVSINKISEPPAVIAGNKICATYINHATVLVQTNGVNILTDPVWSERVSPIKWLGPKRVYPPPISLEKMPKIDVILISHNHYDHLDLDTIRKIYKMHKPKIYTGLGLDVFFKQHKIDAIGLDWWDEIIVNETLKITYVPSQHWSLRKLSDKNQTLWGGFVISAGPNQVYFSGDTGYYQKHFQDIGKKFPNIKLALLPIGAYKPEWFMHHNHMNPEEAVRAAMDLNSKLNLAIHYDTFNLAGEDYNQAPRDLEAALKKHKKSKAWFKNIMPGDTIEI